MLTRAVRPPRSGPGSRRRLVTAALGLLAVYGCVLALGDSRVGSVADVGGKLATAEAMVAGDTATPDVGYWAEDLDPAGRFHPLANTRPVGEHWVQATSVPYSLATAASWRVAGPTGLAVLSMAGALLAALAAARLARGLGAGDGMVAFWLVGLAGPLALYALDGWEHAPGVGLTLWGIALALEATTPGRWAAAGALLASGALLRADLAVYVAVFALSCLAVGPVRRRLTGRPWCAAAAVLGGLAPLVANEVLERALLSGGARAGRASDVATGAGQEVAQRLTDAVLTTVGLFADEGVVALALGLVLLAALGVLAARVSGAPWATDTITRTAAVVAVALYALRFVDGPGFVPGAVAAAPLVVLAAGAPRRAETTVLLSTALGSLPLIWLLAWSGNHVPQWGGRYVLLSTTLLLVLAAVAIGERGWRAGPTPVLVGLAAAVGLFGAVWHVQRTTVVADAGDTLAAGNADAVVVALHPQLGRELGAWYGATRWLSADPADPEPALAVARAVDTDRIVVVERPGAAPVAVDLPGFALVDEAPVPYLGGDLRTRTFARD